MVLEHLAAILLFSGPLFWVGLWMVIAPADIAMLPEWCVRVSRNAVRKLSGLPSEEIVESGHDHVSRQTRVALRLAGVVLVLFAIAA